MKGWGETTWEVSLSKKGNATLKLGGRQVHSRYDPLKEANGIADRIVQRMASYNSQFAVLIGHGLGYLPAALKERGVRHIVWEPLLLVHEMLYQYNYTAMAEQVVYDYRSLSDYLKEVLPLPDPVEVVVHPGYEAFCRMEYRLAIRLLAMLSNVKPRLENAVFSRRSLENLPLLPAIPPMETLGQAFAGQTVYLVTNGPSLEACLPMLRERKGGVVMAALQAVGSLQKEGVKVDIAVAPDPIPHREWTDAVTQPPALVLAETGVHPDTLKWLPERTRLFHIPGPQLHHFYAQTQGFRNIQLPLATVSETMMILADRLGFSTLVMVGMDFCWQQERYSASYTQAAISGGDFGEVHFPVQSRSGPAMTHSVYFQANRCIDLYIELVMGKKKTVLQQTNGLPAFHAHQISPSELNELCRSAPPFAGLDWTASHWDAQAARSAALEVLDRAVACATGAGEIMGGVSTVLEEELHPFFLPMKDPAECEALIQQARAQLQ